MADRLPFSGEQYWNAVSRNAFPGAKLFTYTSLSRTTLKATFTDAGAGTPHTNPVIADANGLFDAIYGNGEYFIDIKDTTEATLIYQEDEVFGTSPANANITTTVSLIADLRLVDTTAFQSAFVEGTTAIDDGGQGRFFFDSGSSAIDNGTTIIAPTVGTGRWLILRTGTDSISTSNIVDENITLAKLAWMPLSAKDGLLISNGSVPTTDIDITTGRIEESGQTKILNLSSVLTKEIDNDWSAGNGGGFPTGITLATDTWYRVFIIAKTDGTTDAGFDTSATATNLLADATGYTLFRRIGWARTNGSSNILPFLANGLNSYVWDVMKDEGISTNASGVSFTCDVPPSQIGQFVYTIAVNTGTQKTGILTQTAQTNTAPTLGTVFHVVADANDAVLSDFNSVEVALSVDSSSQIRHREESATNDASVFTMGWSDNIEIA